ncbi:MAG: hypothetical protein EOO45_12720 [Flavobacterium sp.]|nr:MAG: hypothetical protein EOO45_12720 [Flavobacterium sp.]
MFSTGQIYFAIFFIIIFVAAMIYVYRKDLPLHKVYYKGSYWVLLGFFSFIGILFIIKHFLKD